MLLKVQKRDLTGKKVRFLRRENKIPASVYGPDTKPFNVVVGLKSFHELYKNVGYSKMFDLQLEDESSFKALIKEMQVNPVRGNIMHISFYQVDPKREINAEVPIIIAGTSQAVKNNVGLLVEPVSALPIHCLPKDLPSEIIIDVSNLNEIGDSVTLKSIKLPEGVEVRSAEDNTILAYIAAPQKTLKEEEEEAAAKAAAEAEARGEVLEPEAGAEGEAVAGEGVEGAEGAVTAEGAVKPGAEPRKSETARVEKKKAE